MTKCHLDAVLLRDVIQEMSLKPKKVVSVKLAVYVTVVTHSSLAIHWRSDAVPCPITIYIGH